MDGLALLTKAAAVTTPAAVTEDDDDEVFALSGDSARRDGTDGPRRRANTTRKRPAEVVETCVEIKILRRVRAASSRRPHEIDATASTRRTG